MINHTLAKKRLSHTYISESIINVSSNIGIRPVEIFTLNIKFPYDEEETPWSRTIEVKEDFTLRELHKYIQKIVDFDDDHLYEFYLGRNSRNKSHTLSKSTALNEIYLLNGLKLYYLFDFGDSWLFEVRKSRKKKMLVKKIKYPSLVESLGVNPEQYPEYEC